MNAVLSLFSGVQCAVRHMQCALFSVHCAVYNEQCAVCCVHSSDLGGIQLCLGLAVIGNVVGHLPGSGQDPSQWTRLNRDKTQQLTGTLLARTQQLTGTLLARTQQLTCTLLARTHYWSGETK